MQVYVESIAASSRRSLTFLQVYLNGMSENSGKITEKFMQVYWKHFVLRIP